MEVVIDGVKYLPATQVLANRDAVIRGLMEQFWGELGEKYDEEDRCGGVYVLVTDSLPDGYDVPPTVLEVVDKIAEYAVTSSSK